MKMEKQKGNYIHSFHRGRFKTGGGGGGVGGATHNNAAGVRMTSKRVI